MPDAQSSSGTVVASWEAPDWSGFEWTGWVPLMRAAVREAIPATPGLYRVRRAGRHGAPLIYIGQTARGLRERLLALAVGANATECPFNDPHTAAPHLWLLRTKDGATLECSSTPVEADSRRLRAIEDFLLWQHRMEVGCSTEANYGRFFRGYRRPTNRWVVTARGRAAGRRAVPLGGDETTVDFARTHPALHGPGRVLDQAWWERCSLSDARRLPRQPAVYVIHSRTDLLPVYIGETSNLSDRGRSHSLMHWPIDDPAMSYWVLPSDTPKHVLHELESDLLGWHYSIEKSAPAMQYVSMPSARLAEAFAP